MAITTVEPGKNEEIDPADAAKDTVDETLGYGDRELEEMFGTRLMDEAGVDSEVFEAQVSDETSLERDGNDFTEHAFAAVHSGQRSMLAARGGGNVNDKDHSIHGDPKADSKDPYKNVMLMSALLAGTAQDIAMRNAMDRADAVRRSMEEAAIARAAFLEAEQAATEAAERGDFEEAAAHNERATEAAAAYMERQDAVQQDLDQMGLAIDDIGLEVAATRAANEGMTEDVLNAAKAEIEDAGGLTMSTESRNGLSPEARQIFDEAQDVSMQIQSRIITALESGQPVNLEGLEEDVSLHTSNIFSRFDGLQEEIATLTEMRATQAAAGPMALAAEPINPLAGLDTGIACNGADSVQTRMQDRLGVGQGALLGDIAVLPELDRNAGAETPILGGNTGVTVTAGSGFDALGDSVTTAAALGGGLDDRNGYTAETFAASADGQLSIPPDLEPEQTAELAAALRADKEPGIWESFTQRITNPVMSMFD